MLIIVHNGKKGDSLFGVNYIVKLTKASIRRALVFIVPKRGGVSMEYKKPVIVAENNQNGSFAAGCPSSVGCSGGYSDNGRVCNRCERTK